MTDKDAVRRRSDGVVVGGPVGLHECPACRTPHVIEAEPPKHITYCRTCGKTRMVEWLHKDCPDD